MRILFTRFPLESAHGGAEVQTLGLLEHLRAHGHDVRFAGSCPVLLAACRTRGIPAEELVIGPPPVSRWHACTFLWRRYRMRRALGTLLETMEKPDVLCMLSLSEKIVLTADAARAGVRCVWIEHDRVGRWLRWNPWLPLLLSASRHATTVVVSQLSKRVYRSLGWRDADIRCIVNGVDPVHLATTRTAPVPRTRYTIGCVARLSHDKGVDILLRAIEDLPEVDLHIVGDGNDAARIRSMAASINARSDHERIHLHTHMDAPGDFYRSVDVLVLPSRLQDPCPLAPMEALWMGTPVILTEVCGTAEYLRNGIDAMIIPPESVSAVRSAIVDLGDPQRRQRMAEEGKKTAHAEFSFDRMARAYLDLFRSPLHDAPHA